MPAIENVPLTRGHYLIFHGLFGIACFILSACSDEKTSHIEKIRERGEIVVVTRYGPTSYYIEKNTDTGFEYELARMFADHLGVQLRTVVARNINDVIETINNNNADFAAAALINNHDGGGRLTYGPGFQWVSQQLVYRNGQRPPASLNDISPDRLDLASDTLTFLQTDHLIDAYPDLTWNIHGESDSHEMLELLENREILYTIAASNELVLARQYYPEIRVAFDISQPQPVAWGFRKSNDLTLLNEVWRFYEAISGSGELAALLKRIYGPMEKFDYIESRKFVDRFGTRFPAYQSLFENVAAEHDLDWRLLAALSYQESHWDEQAVSITGVRGLMMLTLDTAKSVGVDDRLDPEQSIRGGSVYLKSLIDKIPEGISEPDRTWMAIAAYNVGFGHLEDARILTEQQGGNPDNWLEVKQRLPLLSRKKWYKQTRYGYARGSEPVLFVERVRRYYNTLVQLTQPDIRYVDRSGEELVETLAIDSPVL